MMGSLKLRRDALRPTRSLRILPACPAVSTQLNLGILKYARATDLDVRVLAPPGSPIQYRASIAVTVASCSVTARKELAMAIRKPNEGSFFADVYQDGGKIFNLWKRKDFESRWWPCIMWQECM